MRHIIGVIAILQLVTARPQNNDIKNIYYESVSDGRGNFMFAFETSNGIAQQQSGEMKIVNSTTNSTMMKGAYSVVTPDNTPSLNLLTRRSDKEEPIIAAESDIPVEEQKAGGNGNQLQTVSMPMVANQGNATNNCTNQTASKEFPDRIGTPAIITLMGPPG